MKEKEKLENKSKKNIDKSQIFGKILAGILALMMLVSVAATLIYSLI